MAPLDDEIDDDGGPLRVPRPALAWQEVAATHALCDHIPPDGVVCLALQLVQRLRNAAREVIRWIR